MVASTGKRLGRRWRVVSGPHEGKVGHQTGALRDDLVLQVGEWPSYFVTVKRTEVIPEWHVGDAVRIYGLRGRILTVNAHVAQVFHEAGGGRPEGVSIVALRYLEPSEAQQQ